MKTLACFLSAAALLGLTACNVLPLPQADNVRYFTLSGPTGAVVASGGVRVRPVQLAGHLHGREMAVRVAEHEVTYLADVRWAEPLDDAILQVLRSRLGGIAGEATVSVQVERFELVRSEANSVQLAATYTVTPAEGGKASARRAVFTSTPRTWDGKDYGTLVGQLRDAVGELGEAIAATLAANN
jgi:uncharacterized lipoprotein YmbA